MCTAQTVSLPLVGTLPVSGASKTRDHQAMMLLEAILSIASAAREVRNQSSVGSRHLTSRLQPQKY